MKINLVLLLFFDVPEKNDICILPSSNSTWFIMEVVCKNCNHTFEGNFCNLCGQSADTHEINKDFLLHDVVLGFFSFDKGILFTIKELFTRPGLAIKDFLMGKRVRYFRPLSFVLLSAGIYIFIAIFFNIDVTHISAYEGNKADVSYQISRWMTNNFAITSLAVIPLIALGSFLAFRKKGYNYTEHIVINSYVSGLSLVIGMVFLFVALFVPKEYQWGTISALDITVGTIFRIWALYQIFSNVKPAARIARVFLSLVYFALIFIFVIIIVTIVIAIILFSFK